MNPVDSNPSRTGLYTVEGIRFRLSRDPFRGALSARRDNRQVIKIN
jgi:hypothetical protein